MKVSVKKLHYVEPNEPDPIRKHLGSTRLLKGTLVDDVGEREVYISSRGLGGPQRALVTIVEETEHFYMLMSEDEAIPFRAYLTENHIVFETANI